ncbi:unnamed protein product [Rotaria sordida]|uniref:Reverse transcriptase domain-containing protein n=1 Tax=Rotaria sordida TaxID=392033 RepID=A0A815CWS0_9BILA|nr:unnamed protein product [Rotaria sordida]CAF4016412.1 unnamed protein product [Rotaria sordida]
MYSTFHKYIDEFVIIYLDDILIYSMNEHDHLNHIKLDLQLLCDNHLYSNKAKYEFDVDRINFLGHIVTSIGIKANENKVIAIKNWPIPHNSTSVQSFLGAAAFYRRCIPNFSEMEALLTAPVVVTNASMIAVEGALMQNDGDGERPIPYESRQLNDVPSRYPIHEQELLAIIMCLRTWRCYLEGITFIIRIDHKSLQHISMQKHLSHCMVRWVEYLQQFNFEIEYKPGRENVVANASSRLYTLQLTAIEYNQNLDWPLLIPHYLQYREFSDDVPNEIKELIQNE